MSLKAPDVSEIHPELTKALNTVGLSWLTLVIPVFKRRGPEGVLQLQGYHTVILSSLEELM